MNILKRKDGLAFSIADPEERVRRSIALRICKFANGVCECRARRHVCARVENEAAAIIEALRNLDGAL